MKEELFFIKINIYIHTYIQNIVIIPTVILH